MHRTLIFGSIVLAILTIGSGLIHGRLSNRWGESEDLHKAGELLADFPMTSVGNWKCTESTEIGKEALEMLESAGSISRVYVNRQTGASIRLFSIVGPRGPTVAHTPDACYSSRDYHLVGELTRREVKETDGKTHTFWSRIMKSNDQFDQHSLDAWYAWSTGKEWSAPDNSRFAYLTSPNLYKLQLAYLVPPKDGTEEQVENGTKELTEFLEGFLPLLSHYMN